MSQTQSWWMLDSARAIILLWSEFLGIARGWMIRSSLYFISAFEKDVVLLVSSRDDLQLVLGWFTTEYEVPGIRIRTSKPAGKGCKCSFWVGDSSGGGVTVSQHIEYEANTVFVNAVSTLLSFMSEFNAKLPRCLNFIVLLFHSSVWEHFLGVSLNWHTIFEL